VGRLTVVVPYYYNGDTLEECINALLNSNSVREIFLIDDCSDLPDVLSSLQALNTHGRLKIQRLNRNMGVQWVRNYGWSRISREEELPEFVLFNDADKIWYPGRLDLLVEELDGHPEADFCYCDFDRTGEINTPWMACPWNPERLKRMNYIDMNTVIRTGKLPAKPFVEDEERLQDWSLWLRMMKDGSSGHHVPVKGFKAHYRRGDVSTAGHDHWARWRKLIGDRYL